MASKQTEKKINAQDLKFSIADESSTTSSIGITDTLTITSGEGIDTSISQKTLTISGEDASTSNKGVASFSSDDFDVSSGAVTVKSSGITNAQLAGSIAASKLAGSIGDSLLSTISTAGKVELGALEIDGASEMGAALADADLLIVDDGAGGTEKSMLASRIPTYVFSKVSGDATVASNGALTIASQAVENSMLADDAVGADELAANAVVNASVSSSAAIAFSKMEDLTASRALVSDGSGDVSASAVTSTEIGHLDGVSSNIQTQLDTKATNAFAIAQAVALG